MVHYQATWPDGFTVVWRNLTWQEYNQYRQMADERFTDPMALYMTVYGAVRIEGPVPSQVPAGIAAWIGAQQMRDNPFGGERANVEQVLNTARAAVTGNYLLAAKGFVAAAFHIPFSEIEQMDVDTFFARVAQAELVLNRTIGLTPLEPAKPQRGKTKDARALAVQRAREARQQEPVSGEANQYVFTRGTPPAPK